MNSATGFSGLLFFSLVESSFSKADNSLQSKCFVSQELSSEKVNSLLSDRRIHCNALKIKSVNICSWRFPARPYHGNPNLAWPDEKSLKFLAEKNKQERESSDQGRLGSQTRRARYPASRADPQQLSRPTNGSTADEMARPIRSLGWWPG